MVAITRVTESVQTPAEKAPEPDMGDEVIPRERYISKDFMDLEWERMWHPYLGEMREALQQARDLNWF